MRRRGCRLKNTADDHGVIRARAAVKKLSELDSVVKSSKIARVGGKGIVKCAAREDLASAGLALRSP